MWRCICSKNWLEATVFYQNHTGHPVTAQNEHTGPPALKAGNDPRCGRPHGASLPCQPPSQGNRSPDFLTVTTGALSSCPLIASLCCDSAVLIYVLRVNSLPWPEPVSVRGTQLPVYLLAVTDTGTFSFLSCYGSDAAEVLADLFLEHVCSSPRDTLTKGTAGSYLCVCPAIVGSGQFPEGCPSPQSRQRQEESGSSMPTTGRAIPVPFGLESPAHGMCHAISFNFC